MVSTEIGSDFQFPLSAIVGRKPVVGPLPLAGPNTRFLASGRDALHWIIRSLGLAQGAQVLLPAYLCEDVLKPFQTHGLRVTFYKTNVDLLPDTSDLASKLSSETRILLFINYFGFPFHLPGEVMASAGPNTTVVEDSSHALLSSLGCPDVASHIRFASFRKLFPVPDGGVISWDPGRLPEFTPAKTRRSISAMGAVSCRCGGAVLKNLWMGNPRLYPKALYRRLFSWSEFLLDSHPKPASMSSASKRIIRSLDLSTIFETRRRNFQQLLSGLADVDGLRPLFTSLPEGVCPLGFPIQVEDRDRLARHLIANRVYPPIHWKLPESVDREEFQEEWSVSSRILTLPIDQRYDEADMGRIAELVHSCQGSRVPWPAGR